MLYAYTGFAHVGRAESCIRLQHSPDVGAGQNRSFVTLFGRTKCPPENHENTGRKTGVLLDPGNTPVFPSHRRSRVERCDRSHLSGSPTGDRLWNSCHNLSSQWTNCPLAQNRWNSFHRFPTAPQPGSLARNSGNVRPRFVAETSPKGGTSGSFTFKTGSPRPLASRVAWDFNRGAYRRSWGSIPPNGRYRIPDHERAVVGEI
jgi:hypothetical protein